MSRIHAFIISWNGMQQKAAHIATCLAGAVDHLTVIYSNASGCAESGAGEWVMVDNDHYYGRKFATSLKLMRGDINLQIQADAESDDWPALIADCRAAFSSIADLGVWAPEIDWTPFPTQYTRIAVAGGGRYVFSANTDGIVWAMSPEVSERMNRLEYEHNNLGWGIEWTAIVYSYTHAKLVITDRNCSVRHIKGSGYSRDLAATQMAEFFKQLTPAERVMQNLLNGYITMRRAYPDPVS